MLIFNILDLSHNFLIQIYEKATESVSPRMQSAPKPQNTAQSGSERTGSQTKSADRILLLN